MSRIEFDDIFIFILTLLDFKTVNSEVELLLQDIRVIHRDKFVVRDALNIVDFAVRAEDHSHRVRAKRERSKELEGILDLEVDAPMVLYRVNEEAGWRRDGKAWREIVSEIFLD